MGGRSFRCANLRTTRRWSGESMYARRAWLSKHCGKRRWIVLRQTRAARRTGRLKSVLLSTTRPRWKGRGFTLVTLSGQTLGKGREWERYLGFNDCAQSLALAVVKLAFLEFVLEGRENHINKHLTGKQFGDGQCKNNMLMNFENMY
jgi:hypothetical protein